jgi:integrase
MKNKHLNERLGLHHIAYLRALAEGLSVEAAASRYLHEDHARSARRAHRAVVERARALARRRRDPAWRLIGIEVHAPIPHQAVAQPLPSLEAWAEAQGLDGLREAELQELYVEAFGLAAAPAEDTSLRRRRLRSDRLRQRQLAVLRALETTVAQPAQSGDPVDGWLPPALAEQLVAAGVLTLAELQQRIERGGRWWRPMLRAYGPVKAQRLAQHLALLMAPPGGLEGPSCASVAPAAGATWLPAVPAAAGSSAAVPRDRVSLAAVARLLFGPPPADGAPVPLPGWVLGGNQVQQGAHGGGGGMPSTGARLAATDDRAAVREWIATRAGSAPTAVRYEREAERWMLWVITERGRPLSAATALDCRLYMDHLANLPGAWISRRNVARWAPGWAPFKGPLLPASQAYAVHVLHGLYEWLAQAGYLAGNPWALINRRVGSGQPSPHQVLGPQSRAFTPRAWTALQAHLAARSPGPATARLRWLLAFAEATGLRAAELLHAEVGHLHSTPTGWLLAVVGKGSKARVVPVPHAAMQATRQYLESRGLAMTTAPPGTPLLAALGAPLQPVSYAALYESFTRFVRRALAASDLSPAERDQAAGAAVHWLRHTHATRAAERGVPPDVVQAGLGHVDPRQTAAYYRAQMERRQKAMERAFSGDDAAG